MIGLEADGSVSFTAPGSPPPVPVEALWDARAIAVLVAGAARAAALQAMLEQPPSQACPASLLRAHPRLIVLCDRAAASALRPAPARASDRAVVVLGHREPGSAPSTASPTNHAPGCGTQPTSPATSRPRSGAHRLDADAHGRGLGSRADAHRVGRPGQPALPEVGGRNTAENATHSLPLLLASGAIRRVTDDLRAEVEAVADCLVRAPFGDQRETRCVGGAGVGGSVVVGVLPVALRDVTGV